MLALSKADARKALVRAQFREGDLPQVVSRLRSIQFDPLSPLGCNHDLVLHARVPNYKVGDWQEAAYQKRLIYDGWDKMASLLPTDAYPSRKWFYHWARPHYEAILSRYPLEVGQVIRELAERGPLLPSQLSCHRKTQEFQGTWYGPNLSKQILRSLWHTGQVMTFDRKGNQHRYALPDRVLPSELIAKDLSEGQAIRQIVLDRHAAVGFLRPRPGPTIWGLRAILDQCQQAAEQLVKEGELSEVSIDGQMYRALPALLEHLDSSPEESRAYVLGPLDPLLWDRRAIEHLFLFDYIWEVYKPAHLRKWGYYVLPVLWRDRFIARFEARFTDGRLVFQSWTWEDGVVPEAIEDVRVCLVRLAKYGSAREVVPVAAMDSLGPIVPQGRSE